MGPNAETAIASTRPCASAIESNAVGGEPATTVVTTAPAPITKNMKVPAISASSARVCSVTDRMLAFSSVSDFKPVEANKARILSIKVAADGTTLDDANSEWVEIAVTLDSDLANWRVQQLRPLWKVEIPRPMDWEWLYTFGSPAFVGAGEIYRIHSGSRIRAAMHPLADDLTSGRKHVYVAGPLGAARLIWERGDYVRLVDAFGTVIDEVIVWPLEPAGASRSGAPTPAAGTPSSGARASG